MSVIANFYLTQQLLNEMMSSTFLMIYTNMRHPSGATSKQFITLRATYQIGLKLRHVCMCVVIPFILDIRLVGLPAEVTQDEGHTGFLHLPSAVFAFIFLARRIQPFFSLVDREV